MSISESPRNLGYSFDKLLATFSEFLGVPSDDLPSVRCLSREQLEVLVTNATLSLPPFEGAAPTVSHVIDRLTGTHLIQPISLDAVREGTRADRFFAVGLGFDPAEIHPFELLQAMVPTGVVCYMSALEFHELTTQPTVHHHIARIETSPSRVARPSAPVKLVARPSNAKPRKPSLGVWQLSYRALDYYVTNRNPYGLVSYQRRYLNSQSWFRVTTLEQTLLDTLHRPLSCGGPSVVFEAWETAAPKINADRLFALLTEISNEGLTRRAGYMIERLGDDFTPLRERIFQLLLVNDDTQRSAPSLLPGVAYTSIDSHWGLAVP